MKKNGWADGEGAMNLRQITRRLEEIVSLKYSLKRIPSSVYPKELTENLADEFLMWL